MKFYISIILCQISFYCSAQLIPVIKPEKKPETPSKTVPASPTKTSTPRVSYATIKFISDADGILFIDGEKKGNLIKNTPTRVSLPKGDYLFRAEGADGQDNIKWNYSVTETGIEKIQEIGLQEIINQRLQAEQRRKENELVEQKKREQRIVELKGNTTEGDYYRLTAAALSAKDYPQTMDWAKKYMAAFPDKPQPYTFYRKAAIASDPDTTSGKGVELLQYIDSIYSLNKNKYKAQLFLDEYYTILYYINKQNALKKSPDFKVKSDGNKTEVVDQFLSICKKGLEVTEKMIALYPDVADDNNKFAQSVKREIQKNIDYYSKPPAKKSGLPTPG
jgi:hypothetical protein